MPFEKNASSYRREVAARLKKLAAFGPMVDGSLVVVRRRCGNPGCRCTADTPPPQPAPPTGRQTSGLFMSDGHLPVLTCRGRGASITPNRASSDQSAFSWGT